VVSRPEAVSKELQPLASANALCISTNRLAPERPLIPDFSPVGEKVAEKPEENSPNPDARIEPLNRTERRHPRRLCVSDLRGAAIPATGR